MGGLFIAGCIPNLCCGVSIYNQSLLSLRQLGFVCQDNAQHLRDEALEKCHTLFLKKEKNHRVSFPIHSYWFLPLSCTCSSLENPTSCSCASGVSKISKVSTHLLTQMTQQPDSLWWVIHLNWHEILKRIPPITNHMDQLKMLRGLRESGAHLSRGCATSVLSWSPWSLQVPESDLL